MTSSLPPWPGPGPAAGEIKKCPACGRFALVFLPDRRSDDAPLIGRCRNCERAWQVEPPNQDA